MPPAASTSLWALKPWLEAQPFFLVGSASAAGACDCSYRGRQTEGVPEPLLEVVNEESLVFPDYPGNNLFNTIGNLLEHGEIALLFVDLAGQRTWTVQGRARVDARDPACGPAWSATWPTAPRCIFVRVRRVTASPVAGLPHLDWVAG